MFEHAQWDGYWKQGNCYFITLLHSISKLQLIIKALCVYGPFVINLEMGGGIVLTKFLTFFLQTINLEATSQEIRQFFDTQSSNNYFCLKITCT